MAKNKSNNKNIQKAKGTAKKSGTVSPVAANGSEQKSDKARVSILGVDYLPQDKVKSEKKTAPARTVDIPSHNAASAVAAKPVKKAKLKLEFRNYQWESNIPLILFLFFIVVYGLIVLYSVSAPVGYVNSKFTTSGFFALSQLKFSVAGIIIALIINFIPIDFFKKKFFMISAYAVSFGLIAATAVIGVQRQNARRWIKIGGTEFQTSEVFKLGLVLSLAMYRLLIVHLIETGKLKPKNPKNSTMFYAFFEFILPAVLIIVPALLVLAQPHFSCFLILGVVTFVCFLVSGINFKSWAVGILTLFIAGAIIVGALLVIPGTQDKVSGYIQSNFAHVFKRFSIYTRDEEEELTDQQKDEALQVERAKDAIGTGGLKGVGFGSSRSKYSYVSESHNDYIYSIYVEETGFIGGTLLIVFYLGFLFMGLRVAMKAKDVFCRIIATGYTFLIVLEAMWNIGVELTVLPSTGITLPFFSYGGTAQILLLIAYGMILCVARSGVVYPKKDGKN